jgi:membrane protease YdiL (CAAX protease family)
MWSQKWAVAIGIIVALNLSTLSGPLLKPILVDLGIRGYAYLIVLTMIDLGLLLAAILMFSGRSLGDVAALSGLTASPSAAAVMAVAVFVPAAAICAQLVPIVPGVDPADFAWKVLAAPFVEELAFRGIALGMLIRFCGWPFLPAVLLPAVIFGAEHAAQGSDAMETAGIVAITALGGLFFGWLFVRWGFNLWVAFVMHAGMNGLWYVFDLGTNAIGGWFGNALRLAIVVVAIAITYWATHKTANLWRR